MQLFFNSQLTDTHSHFTFSSDESKHIIRVLRKKKGDTVWITNGKGLLCKAEISQDNAKKCEVVILSYKTNFTKKHTLHLAVAPTKQNDRFEWFLEKATEIGVQEITPIICERSERKNLKLERMQRVIESAMKQSLQTFLPTLNPPKSLQDFLTTHKTQQKFIAHCEERERDELKRRVAPDTDVTILIGPEGDFSLNEIKIAKENGYVPVSMGTTRLRTETAAIVACSIVSTINNG